MLTLKHGASSIVVAPEHGAGLIGWMLGRTPLLRRGLPQAAVDGNPPTMGCFPLLPYCNRIGQGRFTWNGTSYRLRGNFGDAAHTIHGLGWQRAWAITAVSQRAVTLALAHRPDPDWPFAFDAFLTYALDEALTITIGLTNRHATPAPAGIGLHPYFPKAYDPALRFNATGAWQNGDNALPCAFATPPAAWRHMKPRAVSQSRLDNCFTGWDQTAEFAAGPASLRIAACDAFACLQVFTPSWADFFCVEPVTHIPDAINRPDLPLGQAMARLAPGETLGGTIRLIPELRGPDVQPAAIVIGLTTHSGDPLLLVFTLPPGMLTLKPLQLRRVAEPVPHRQPSGRTRLPQPSRAPRRCWLGPGHATWLAATSLA